MVNLDSGLTREHHDNLVRVLRLRGAECRKIYIVLYNLVTHLELRIRFIGPKAGMLRTLI
jgi:hypothetical protein